jgi:septum formation protein
LVQTLILASRSESRAALLRQAGVACSIWPADVDEDAAKVKLLARGAGPDEIASALAGLKALEISQHMPKALVLGADQVLVCGGKPLSKAGDLAEARDQLKFLRGKAHALYSAAAVFEAGRQIWQHVGRVEMQMREFSDGFIDGYQAAQGDDVLSAVGCYKLEGAGAQLFSSVSGDYFSVMGLPLLELLEFLRRKGVCPT